MYCIQSVLLLGLLVFHGGMCQRLVWEADMDRFFVQETQALNEQVYTLRAFLEGSESEDVIRYGIRGGPFRVNTTSGGVHLATQLDYETQSQYTFIVEATLGNLQTERQVTVNVADDNDEYPIISTPDGVYNVTIQEDLPPGSLVFPVVEVNDPDGVNWRLQVNCKIPPSETASVLCRPFRINALESGDQFWNGSIVLNEYPVYNPLNPCYTFTLEAYDGNLKSSRTIDVCIEDADDSPPAFTSAMTTSVSENIPQATVILQVTAEDPDEAGREIHYSLRTNPGGLFGINGQNGSIFTTQPLSRTNPLLSQGFITFQVAASEVLGNGIYGNTSNTMTVATVTVIIADTNDNTPVFQPDHYTVSINENLPPMTQLPGLSMSVTDMDQLNNADFSIYLENYGDIFEVHPVQAVGSAPISILVKNPDLIDFDGGRTSYNLTVVARERNTTEMRTGRATVIITILDENDNAPVFTQTSYSASVRETASGDGSSILRVMATDKDSGIYGTESIRYRILGNGANRFHVNILTGAISVASCPTPGSGNCLDYEDKKVYDLTIEAWDSFGEGNPARVPLTITILGDNDNRPQFFVKDVIGYIEERTLEPSPSIRVQAFDADSPTNYNNHFYYSIVPSHYLWRVNSRTGQISASAPVPYPKPEGYYRFKVRASDPNFYDTANVTIFVQDVNDRTPVFTFGGRYEQTIPENSPPGTTVYTVEAIDDDPSPGPNGEVEYRISTGAQDKFIIDDTSGLITVAPGATFDVEAQPIYTLSVIASDNGQPPRSATATLVVTIQDVNNRSPYFQPSAVRVDVYEDAVPPSPVIAMVAKDQDVNADLQYRLLNITATDLNNLPVNPNEVDFRTWFIIELTSGMVRVNGSLDREKAATIQARVQVNDINGVSEQVGYGSLTITILGRNVLPPVFDSPWSPTDPYIRTSMAEEQPKGTSVVFAQATDPDGRITGYGLVSNPGSYLAINEQSGELTIARPIDYETDQMIRAVVVAMDSGDPQLTSTATVEITLININDNTPVFTQPFYEATILENSIGGTYVTRVNATDLDLGDFGNVRYALVDLLDKFEIDIFTGVIRVKPGAVLDRETNPQLTVSVRAYDSPLNTSLSRSDSVLVTITLEDVNEGPPVFIQTTYYAVAYETYPVDTDVIKVIAVDPDVGSGNNVTYTIVNDTGLFKIDGRSGQIQTASTLSDRRGVYNLTVTASDTGSNGNSTSRAYVVISVVSGNNGPPVWVYPPISSTHLIIENQYVGREVDKYVAYDNDSAVTYGFYFNNDFVQNTPDFTINNITGQVTTRRAFDRETRAVYHVMLAARDFGNPQMTSYRLVTYNIGDVNDNEPEFPTTDNCCPIPAYMTISENSVPNTYIGQAKAWDPDLGDNATIIYNITEGDTGMFAIDSSGNVTLIGTLDYSVTKDYKLKIKASNPSDITDLSSECLCKNKSSIFVYIHVNDSNNSPPTFPQTKFNACIALDAEVDTWIHQVQAEDKDTGINASLEYRITNLTSYDRDGPIFPNHDSQTFYINKDGGIYNNHLMTNYENQRFSMYIEAYDSIFTAKAPFWVWVIAADSEVTLTVDGNIEEVEKEIEKIKQAIMAVTNWGVVCVTGIRYHITDGGIVNPRRTDILLHVVNGETNLVYEPGVLLQIFNTGFLKGYGFASIKESYSFWDGFNIDPVLGAVIAIILLLLLSLLLLCCLWCLCALCCADDEEHREYIVPELVNPIWKKKLYEDQELCMAVLDPDLAEDSLVTMHGTYDNQGYVSLTTNGTIKGDVASDGTAKMAIPVTTVSKTTRQETFEMVNVKNSDEADVVAVNGNAVSPKETPRIETTLERSAQMPTEKTDATDFGAGAHFTASTLPVPIIRVGGSIDKPRVMSSSTMTDGGVQYERTQGGAYEAEYTGYSAPESNSLRPNRVGAMLSRPTTPTYARSYHGFSTLGSQAQPFDLDFGYGQGHVDQYDVDMDNTRINSGLQTTNLLSPNYYRAPPVPQYRSYSASIPDDHPTEHSMSPSWVGDEYPDGLYQGEIHLGNVHSNPPSVLHTGEPDGYEERYMTGQRLN